MNVSGGISIAAKTCADHHAKVPAADTSAAAAAADEQMSSPSLPMSANFARDYDDFRCQVVDAYPVISSGAMAWRISCRHYNSSYRGGAVLGVPAGGSAARARPAPW